MIDSPATTQIIEENKRRWAKLTIPYDPLLGIGSPLKREPLLLKDNIEIFIPEQMMGLAEVRAIQHFGSLERAAIASGIPYERALWDFHKARCKYDFENWCATCVKIEIRFDYQTRVGRQFDLHGKQESPIQPFVLNPQQRKYMKVLMEMFFAGAPVRVILLKSRQWGGSTLTQMFFAWVQLFWKTHWHSIIVAHRKDAAQRIRGMYNLMAEHHPQFLVHGAEGGVHLKPYERTQNARVLDGRGNIIAVGCADEPDSQRSFTLHLLHLSELSSYTATEKTNPQQLIQSLVGSLVEQPMTVCVKESTAKTIGSYFADAWEKAAKKGSSDIPVFVGFHEDIQYTIPVSSPSEFISTWNDYEKWQWLQGATIEHIAWYREKLKGIPYAWQMKCEFPITADEAFANAGQRIFVHEAIQVMREGCKRPLHIGQLISDALTGQDALKNIRFQDNPAMEGHPNGQVKIWIPPHEPVAGRSGYAYTNRYCAFLDIGGKTERSDWSVLTVIDRVYTLFGGTPRVAAEFRLHLDQDIIAWYAVRMCAWYGNALLAVEVNSLKRKSLGDSLRGYESDHSFTVLDEIKDHYDNLFYRVKPERIDGDRVDGVLGFHTNESTKDIIITTLNAAIRDGGYEEYNSEALDEMDMFELKPGGRTGSPEGKHDDYVISRAGALWLAKQMDAVVEYRLSDEVKLLPKKRLGGYAQF